MCQHLEGLPNSVNQHFPNEGDVTTGHKPLPTSGQTVNFNVMESENLLVRLQTPHQTNL